MCVASLIMARKKDRGSGFIMVFRVMLKDPKWQKLSSSSKITWIYLRTKINKSSDDKREVTLAYSEMKNIMGSQALSKSFKELAKAGFIEKTKKGGLFGGVTKYKFIGEYAPIYYNGVKI